jgi:hypothetical protein
MHAAMPSRDHRTEKRGIGKEKHPDIERSFRAVNRRDDRIGGVIWKNNQ